MPMGKTKKSDAAESLKIVIDALEPLVDTDRQWVLNSAASRWTLKVHLQSTGATGSQVDSASGTGAVGAQTAIGEQDPKTFLRTKNPQSDLQRIACLGYYLTYRRDTPAFKAGNLTKMNTEARGLSFNIHRAVDNASRPQAGYLSAVGKGKKQLTGFGEEVVEALPDQAAVKFVEENRKKGRARKSKRKSKKA